MILDIVLTGHFLAGLLTVVIVVGIVLFFYLLNKTEKYNKETHLLQMRIIKQEGDIRERNLEIEKIQAEVVARGQQVGQVWFEDWKKQELEKYIKVIGESSNKTALAQLHEWKMTNEASIRKDAANRSVRNVLGKVTEHLIPFSEQMKQFNPKDIRFIGSPIDLIVFDGAEQLDRENMTIYFVEVKTGTSALSKRQRIIKEAIQANRVEWLMVDKKDFGDDVNTALAETG